MNSQIDCSKYQCSFTGSAMYVENTHWASDAISLGFAAILFAIAIGLIVGSRIAWRLLIERTVPTRTKRGDR